MVTALMDSVKADHGYNMDSKSVKNLLSLMSQFTKEQRRHFLQFTTGSPKLPIGGMFLNAEFEQFLALTQLV
jgi:E3 ubiquitin-protein ligase TRIP12